MNMIGEARHELIVLNDADIAVDPDYLLQVAAAMAEPGVGAVTCYYRGDLQQIVGIDRDVGVVEHDQLMPRLADHVHQVGDLAVGPIDARVHHDGDVRLRVRLAQALHRGQGRIGRVLHAEHDLHRSRIVLAHEGRKVGQQPALRSAQRLEQGHGRGDARGRPPARPQPADEEGRGEGVGDPGRRQHHHEDPQGLEQNHPSRLAARKLPLGSSRRPRLWQDVSLPWSVSAQRRSST